MVRYIGASPGSACSVPCSSGKPLRVRLSAPSYHLSQAEDYQYDEQDKADQEEYPRHIGHGHAKPMFMTCSMHGTFATMKSTTSAIARVIKFRPLTTWSILETKDSLPIGPPPTFALQPRVRPVRSTLKGDTRRWTVVLLPPLSWYWISQFAGCDGSRTWGCTRTPRRGAPCGTSVTLLIAARQVRRDQPSATGGSNNRISSSSGG